ncbi:response regulator transcription factor [Vagococcus silagei]|uniref:Response regulator transcription factor n=1 Tax=Vagococcus silagei TaxID=2508885 RepID=A0A4S3B1Z6_9ENTE|nr:response regulator transcription factor [Vagococcus silagei]THB61144.1 response regulator transcription factor [Vagococcus silagei]
MKKILIVEDEKRINNLIKEGLTAAGFECCQAFFGFQALKFVQENEFDVILLDVQLPDINGFKLIESFDEIPVLFLTARDSIEDRVTGLELGAEDYLIKPFALEELIARINVILRRKKTQEIFKVAKLTVNLEQRTVLFEGNVIDLTPQEIALLAVFILNQNIALTREQLITQAWGIDYEGDDRTVDVHVQRLRKKLELEHHINTVFKVGYRLDVD